MVRMMVGKPFLWRIKGRDSVGYRLEGTKRSMCNFSGASVSKKEKVKGYSTKRKQSDAIAQGYSPCSVCKP